MRQELKEFGLLPMNSPIIGIHEPTPLVPYAFVWQKGKTMDLSETIVVYDLKLATDDRSDKKFLLTSTLCPLGAVCPLPRGYIHVLNHEKIV